MVSLQRGQIVAANCINLFQSWFHVGRRMMLTIRKGLVAELQEMCALLPYVIDIARLKKTMVRMCSIYRKPWKAWHTL
jgi:hypothetical protein